MHKIRIYFIILLGLLFVLPEPASAQYRKKRRKKSSRTSKNAVVEEEEKPADVRHYLGVYGGGGYSALFHDIEDSSTPGGGAGMLGFEYLIRHKSGFNFRTGIEAMYLNSTTKLNSFTASSGTFLYNDDYYTNHNMEYLLQSDNYREQHNRFSVSLPIMFGWEFSRYYAFVGTKIGFGLLNNFSTKTDLTATLIDPELIDPLGDMYTHDLITVESGGSGALSFGLDVTASAEFGVILDEWMPESALTIGSRRKKTQVTYRAGLFADYGVLNINTNSTSGNITNTPTSGSSSDLLNNTAFNSVLASSLAASSSVNPFVVGAKFTVDILVKPKPKPKPKKPVRPRPKPKTVSQLQDPPFFYCVVSDYDTEEFLDATVSLYSLVGKKDTVFTAVTDPATGFTQNQMKSDQFGIKIDRDGYVSYHDTIFEIASDTLYVDLQPIKKNTIVILENLLFDTDKTVIKNTSTNSLEEMYILLTENPSLKIEITGHTDNVGSRSYNRKLSEGRAKAVYQLMVDRGIDPNRMKWKGKGSSEPIESNSTAEGRAANRRVEFVIL